MKSQRIAAWGALLLLLAVVVIVWRGRRPDEPRRQVRVAAPPVAPGSAPAAIGASAAEESTLADDLDSPRTDTPNDLRILADVLAAYRSNFPHDGNPWGDNRDITRQLTGRNKLHLALIPARHPAINADGELCDRWGTPFFFHAESGTRMAIRSAGPDRKMWTTDDIVLEP